MIIIHTYFELNYIDKILHGVHLNANIVVLYSMKCLFVFKLQKPSPQPIIWLKQRSNIIQNYGKRRLFITFFGFGLLLFLTDKKHSSVGIPNICTILYWYFILSVFIFYDKNLFFYCIWEQNTYEHFFFVAFLWVCKCVAVLCACALSPNTIIYLCPNIAASI